MAHWQRHNSSSGTTAAATAELLSTVGLWWAVWLLVLKRLCRQLQLQNKGSSNSTLEASAERLALVHLWC